MRQHARLHRLLIVSRMHRGLSSSASLSRATDELPCKVRWCLRDYLCD